MDPPDPTPSAPATGLLGSLARALQSAAEDLARTSLDTPQRAPAEALVEGSRALATLLGTSSVGRVRGRVRGRVPPELADVAPGYLARRRRDAHALREAAARGAFEAARRIGHDLRGSGLGYGFASVSEIGARIEAAARRGDAPALLFAAEALAETVEDAIAELRATPHPDDRESP